MHSLLSLLLTALYAVLFLLCYLVSLLPLRVLYGCADVLFLITYYGLRYRREIVRRNLRTSFPQKGAGELADIERGFYRFFVDYIVETLKLFSMSRRQMMRRMTFGGLDELRQRLTQQNVVVYLGHYCNWEWVASLPLHIEPQSNGVMVGQLYHALENEAFDSLFLRLRSRFGAVNIEMMSALRQLVRFRQEGKRFLVGFISDQAPNWNHIHLWTNFLNHKSAVFTGAESLAKSTGAAVYYLDVACTRRGHYHGEFCLMTDTPKQFPDYTLTEQYAALLEATICRSPRFWLWSHNRWKRTFEKYQQRRQPKTEQV
jgi:KDO2-lipid IV(A) lauroyltransferase